MQMQKNALHLTSTIIENQPSFIGPLVLVDPETDLVLLSGSTASRIFGYETLTGQRFSKLHPKSLGELIVFAEEVAHNGRAWTRNLIGQNANGEPILIEYEASYIEHEGQHLLCFVVYDLGERSYRDRFSDGGTPQRDTLMEMHRFKALHLLEKHLHQLILDAAGDGIYGLDADGLTTFLNPAAERMLGWTAGDIIGKNMHDLIHNKRRDGSIYPIHECPISQSIKTEQKYAVQEEYFWRKDGRPLLVEYTSTPIIDKNEILGAVIVFRDITEQHETGNRLREALAEVDKLKERLELENSYLQEEILEERNHNEIIGESSAIRHVLKQIDLVAPTDANVVITGESGTGKELVAQAIHQDSKRSERPLIRLNCATIAREDFEAELFGQFQAGFSGSRPNKIGRFQLADGGTLFLDEVGELPADLQSKLLRVLQDRKIERDGTDHATDADVRIIAASNKDLSLELAEGRFREDLYFRLSVFPITLTPLRERPDDIAPLARHFLKICARRLNVPIPRLSQANIVDLNRYSWPGNARELENVIERALILSNGDKLRFDLPDARHLQKPSTPPSSGEFLLTDAARRQRDVQAIKAALDMANGKVSGPGGAAELLGVKPTTLYSRIRRLGLTS